MGIQMVKKIVEYLCENCGYIQRSPFTDCPACSHNKVYEYKDNKLKKECV
jgi:lipopolysaccharide biosynthesis regulator YciM